MNAACICLEGLVGSEQGRWAGRLVDAPPPFIEIGMYEEQTAGVRSTF